jgi:hypothetical protein
MRIATLDLHCDRMVRPVLGGAGAALLLSLCAACSTSHVIGVAGPRSDAGPPPPADFVARCASPDVVTCIGFDSQDDIAGHVLPAGDGSVDRVVIDPAMRA